MTVTDKTLKERFFKKIRKTKSCWFWTAHTTRGYGRIGIIRNGRPDMGYAHRVSYELHFGKIKNKLDVLHNCDNPSCVNPKHLRLGTHSENMADMVKRKRVRRGEGHRDAKLNKEKVKKIRKEYKFYTAKELAKKHNVFYTTIYDIIYGVTWKHV